MFKLVEFDLKKFLKRQYRIYSKYKDNMRLFDNNVFFYKLDLYLGQILEELSEYKVAVGISEKKKELVDVIMYIGSTISMIEDEYKDELNYNLSETIIIFDNEHDVVSEIFDNIYSIRRKFDERKWHKEIKEISKENNMIRMRDCLDDLFNSLIVSLEQLNHLCIKSGNSADLRLLIKEKQRKFIVLE